MQSNNSKDTLNQAKSKMDEYRLKAVQLGAMSAKGLKVLAHQAAKGCEKLSEVMEHCGNKCDQKVEEMQSTQCSSSANKKEQSCSPAAENNHNGNYKENYQQKEHAPQDQNSSFKQNQNTNQKQHAQQRHNRDQH